MLLLFPCPSIPPPPSYSQSLYGTQDLSSQTCPAGSCSLPGFAFFPHIQVLNQGGMPLLPSPLPPSSSRLTSIYPSGFSFKNHLPREKALLDYGSHFQMESGALHQLPMCCLIPVVIYGTLPGIQQVINTLKKKIHYDCASQTIFK